MEQPNRQYSQNQNYRYGFNGKENDRETNSLDFGARHYDSRIAKWLSTDPLAHKMPEWSPYNFGFNNPIVFIDPDGEEPVIPWPKVVIGGVVTSTFGLRVDPFGKGIAKHGALDLGAPTGTDVHSFARGTVIDILPVISPIYGKHGYGNAILVQHKDGYYTLYAHLSSVNVEIGQEVGNGEKLGEVGNTGRSTASHLHLEVIKYDGTNYIDIYADAKTMKFKLDPQEIYDLDEMLYGDTPNNYNFEQKIQKDKEKIKTFKERLDNLNEKTEKFNKKLSPEKFSKKLERFNEKLERFNGKVKKFNEKLKKG